MYRPKANRPKKNEAKQTKVVANMDSRWKPKYALFVDKMHWSRSDNGCCRHVERLLRALEGGEGGQGSTKRGWWRSWESESPFRSWYGQKHNHVNAQLTRHCLQINVNRWQEIELLGCERFWKLGARERWFFFSLADFFLRWWIFFLQIQIKLFFSSWNNQMRIICWDNLSVWSATTVWSTGTQWRLALAAGTSTLRRHYQVKTLNLNIKHLGIRVLTPSYSCAARKHLQRAVKSDYLNIDLSTWIAMFVWVRVSCLS